MSKDALKLPKMILDFPTLDQAMIDAVKKSLEIRIDEAFFMPPQASTSTVAFSGTGLLLARDPFMRKEIQGVVTEARMQEIVESVRYKPHFLFSFSKSNGYSFNPYERNQPSVYFSMRVQSRESGEVIDVGARKEVRLINRASEEAFKMFLFENVLMMEIHETRECFRVMGKQYDDPHMSKGGDDIQNLATRLSEARYLAEAELTELERKSKGYGK